MDMYIEDFLIQNCLINLCLLKLVKTTTKHATNTFKLLLASLFGTIISILTAKLLTNILICNILKFLGYMLMLKICFKTTFKQFLTELILLLLYSFAFYGLTIVLNKNYVLTDYGILTEQKINMWTMLSICLIASHIFELVAKHIKYKLKTNNLIYSVNLKIKQNTISVNAFLDTGNMLTINNQPVLILDLSSFLQLSKQSYIDYILAKHPQNLQVATVTGKSNLKLYVLDNLQINIDGKVKEFQNPIVAVNDCDKFKQSNYQALLSPAFL